MLEQRAVRVLPEFCGLEVLGRGRVDTGEAAVEAAEVARQIVLEPGGDSNASGHYVYEAPLDH